MKLSDYPNRQEYVKDLIVDAMMDDYENFEIIRGCVNNLASEESETVTVEEVQAGLKDLVQGGRVVPYELSCFEPYAVAVPFSEERLHELWYYPTPQERTSYMKRHNITG